MSIVNIDMSKSTTTSNTPNITRRFSVDESEQLDSSVNSMDVSTSVTLPNVQFMSPPQTTTTKKHNRRTPAQKRRQRKYNLRKFKATIKPQQPLLKSKPIVARRTEFTINQPSIISNNTQIVNTINNNSTSNEKQHTTHRQCNKNINTDNNKTTDTVRMVDFITDSDVVTEDQPMKGIIIVSTPDSSTLPTFTMNYVNINSNYVSSFILNEERQSAPSSMHSLNMIDSIIHVNEILFKFDEIATGKTWYYCHYLDLDLHGNIMVLDAHDVPQELIHQFFIKHNINSRDHNSCKQCLKNKTHEKLSIGSFIPCYLHKHKHNKVHYHRQDQIDLIKFIQKKCQKQNKQEQKLVHNPIIHTEVIDKPQQLVCSTIIPTNNSQLTTTPIQFETTMESDTIYGISTTTMTLPDSVACTACDMIHKKIISYSVYQDGFVCDRCGYGQNEFDIIYRYHNESKENNVECTQQDLCCNCAINIMNDKDEDMDINTVLDNKQQHKQYKYFNARTNVPMLTTRFVHHKTQPRHTQSYKPSINYTFQSSRPLITSTSKKTSTLSTQPVHSTLPTISPPTTPNRQTAGLQVHETDSECADADIISSNNQCTISNTTIDTTMISHLVHTVESSSSSHNNATSKKSKEKEDHAIISNPISIDTAANIECKNQQDHQSEAAPLMLTTPQPKERQRRDQQEHQSEAAPLMLATPEPKERQHTKKRYTPPECNDQPPLTRQKTIKTNNTATKNDFQDCTICHNTYCLDKLWRCKNNFKCNKQMCIDCLISKGYNKYYMMNCKKHWYCNECLDENIKLIQEKERKRKQQGQHGRKLKYNVVKFQNKLHCNLSGCMHSASLYATLVHLQRHSIENGWGLHQHMPVWQFWQIKPCLYCLNKYTLHMQQVKQHKQSLTTYTARDVQWIPMNQENNLCERCFAETNNDQDKSLERLEQDNQWADKISDIDIAHVHKLENGHTNYVAALLQEDTGQQLYGNKDTKELPTLLEIKGIGVDQVETLPADKLGRIKIILNKVLFHINNVDKENLDTQLHYLKQLMMMWKIISQRRVRTSSTYAGYTQRSDMDHTLRLIEQDKWSEAWHNMLINKITRNLKNAPALTRFNNLLYNIHDNKGKFDYKNEQDDIQLQQNNDDKISEDDEKQIEFHEMKETPRTDTMHATVHSTIPTPLTIRESYSHKHHSHTTQQQINNPKQTKFNKLRAQYLAMQGKYKKAIDALESDGLCPNNIEYRKLFKSKLESAKGPITKPHVHNNNHIRFNFEHKQISNATRSMDHTAGAGVDAMKIKYLKQLLNNTSDVPELIDNLTKFMTNMANGELPAVVADHIRHSRAISGQKIKKKYKDNKPIRYDRAHDRYFENDYLITIDVRPITIQMGWIRLCNRIIFNSNKQLAKKLCLDKQIGIGCPSGAQALIAAAKIGIDLIKQNPNKAMMKLDFRNCYNTIDRQKVIDIVTRLAPELGQLYYQRYNKEYRLVHVDGTFDIFENGMAQGCNLSTAALGAIQKDAEPKIIQNCKRIKPDWRLNISGKYHDDATDVADIEDLYIYYQESIKIYHDYGMQFKPLKSEIILNRNIKLEDLPPAFQQFKILYERVEILGIPIGDDEYTNQHVILKLIHARDKLNTIRTFNNDKICTDMVRKFNGISKLMYLFSNLPFRADEIEYKKELAKLDRDKITTAVETTLTDIQQQQLELPVSMTGIGIGGMTDMLSSMVLSNYINIKDKIALFIDDKELLAHGIEFLETNMKLALIDYQQRLTKYGHCQCNSDTCTECTLKNIDFEHFKTYCIGLNKNKPINFKYLINVINKLKLQNVYNQSTPQHRIVLNQLINGKIAHKYITAPGYLAKMNNAEWHYNMLRRVGKTITTEDINCPFCKDHPIMDPYGNHASSCYTQNHRINRHDRIKYLIAKLCQNANIRHRVEPKNLTTSNRKPADVLVYGIGNHGLALDVGITDSVSRFNTALKNPKVKESYTNGYYADTYYQQKLDYFQQVKFNFGYDQLQSAPIILENFGYMDPRSLLLINKLITLAAKNMHKIRADVDFTFKTQLSTTLAKAEARAGLARYYYSYDNSYCRF